MKRQRPGSCPASDLERWTSRRLLTRRFLSGERRALFFPGTSLCGIAGISSVAVVKAAPVRYTDHRRWGERSGQIHDLYALKTGEGELVALGAYEVREGNLGVHIVYMESQAENDPTLAETPKDRGVGRALVAYGIKLSVDAGFNGDVTLDAKTPELARHYERDFGAVRLPARESGAAPRYLICDEAAQSIFTAYLEEE